MLAIINTGVANIASVRFACERIIDNVVVTTDAAQIQASDRVILPGVGSAKTGMQSLKDLNLISVIKNLSQPVLGICLGMQLLFEYSAEGEVSGLGIIPGEIKKLPASKDIIVPHMGWNDLAFIDKQFDVENAYVYFVHSYAAEVSEYTLATCTYGEKFSAIVRRDNFFGMQFHPERSGRVGEELLRQFLKLS